MRLNFDEAVDLLLNDQVVAIPTETVYGLAGKLSSEKAVQEIFKLKNRSAHNPLIIHVSSLEMIKPFADSYPGGFEQLVKAFWPGPLTLIFPIIESLVPEAARANLPHAAFRFPNHQITQALIEKTGPLVAPSANLSGTPSPTLPRHVERDFGEDFPVFDGGQCKRGLESTILIFLDGRWKIGRLGVLTPEVFIPHLGYLPESVLTLKDRPPCPGQLYRHYAPKTRLYLQSEFNEATFIVGFSDRSYSVDSLSFGNSDDPERVAQNFYNTLRELDERGIEEAWIDIDFPRLGLWTTIRERLEKAAGFY